MKLISIFSSLVLMVILLSCRDFNNERDPLGINYQDFPTIDSIADFAPAYPVDNSSLTLAPEKLTCTQLLGAETYHAQLASDTEFSSIIYQKADSNSNVFDITNANNIIGKFYFRFRVYSEGSWSVWSDVWSFEVPPKIGDNYRGGIIFYIDGLGGGLVSAEADQSIGIGWGGSGDIVNGTLTAIGTGAANTSKIVLSLGAGTYAAQICADLDLNGYDDWFLPSKDELNLIYLNLYENGVGGFSDLNYWSSSENFELYAWSQDFSTSFQHDSLKNDTHRVRAVRAY